MGIRKNNNTYISRLAKSKDIYHKRKAKIPYEEKVKIILELQKINAEMRSGKKRKKEEYNAKIWKIVL